MFFCWFCHGLSGGFSHGFMVVFLMVSGGFVLPDSSDHRERGPDSTNETSEGGPQTHPGLSAAKVCVFHISCSFLLESN